MYKKTAVFEPFEIDEDQDLWVGEISFLRNKMGPGMDHDACIEVRAESDLMLHARIEKILLILNA